MNIDIRTLAIIVGITNILQVMAIVIQYRANKAYSGIGWWVLGFISMAAGYVLLLLRDVISIKLITIIFANTLILLGPIFLYTGVMRFLDKKEIRLIVISIFTAFILSFSYYTYFDNDITLRTAIVYAASAVISFLTALSLLRHKTSAIITSAYFNTAVFSINGFFFVFRAGVALFIDPVNSLFTTSIMQTASFLFLFIVGVLLTYGLIIMINQRLNSENSEAKKNLELIFNTSPDAVLVSRLTDGIITVTNDGFTTLTKYTHAEVIGKSTLEVNIWENQADRQKIVAMLTKKGFCENMEAVFQRKDGSNFTGIVSAKIITLQNTPHIISVTHDITERKRADEALFESEIKFKSFAEQALVGIYLIQDGVFKYVNPKFAQMFDYTVEECLNNMPFEKLIYAEDLTKVDEQIKRRISGEADFVQYSFRGRKKNGQIFPVEIHRSASVYDGSPAASGTILDITERKRAEDELKQVSTRLSLAIRAGGVGVWDYDILQNRLVWDDQMFSLYGITPDQFGGAYEAWQAGLHPEDRQRGDTEIRMALQDEKDFDTEFRVLWPDGTIHNIRALALVQRDDTGRPVHMIGTNWDITTQKQTVDALRESEERFRQLAEIFPETIFEANLEGYITYANKHGLEHFGYTEEDILSGLNIFNLVTPDDHDKVMTRVMEKIQGIDKGYLEYQAMRKDGTTFHAMGYSTPMIVNGTPLGVRGFILDVTKSKQAEEELKKSDEMLRLITCNMSDMIRVTDLQGNNLYVSPSHTKSLGYKPEDRSGKSGFDIVHPDDVAMIVNKYAEGLASNKAMSVQYRVRHADGHYLWLDTVADLLRDDQGKETAVVMCSRDITDRKHAEEKLLKGEERYRLLVENASEAIMVVQDGMIKFSNQNALEASGYSEQEILSIPASELVHPDDQEVVVKRYLQKIQGDATSTNNIYRSITKSGQVRWTQNNSVLIDWEERPATLSMITDITDQKEAETALLEAKERAEEANRAKSEFLSIMSHEIRTPLNAIIGMSDLLGETQMDDDQRSYVKTFKNAGESLLSIINNILDYSKIEAGKVELEAANFNLIDAVEKVSEIMAMQVHRKNIELIVNMMPDVPYNLRGDQQRLRQVLINLIGNAIKFTEKGEITLTLEKAEEDLFRKECAISFSVSDTGIGIPPDKLQDIFERFSQADSSVTRKFGGTGLGLAISKKLVELMGGDIQVASEIGKGSNFQFTLKFELQKDYEKKPGELIIDMKGLKVLVVDDNSTNRLIINRTITPWGAAVTESFDGKDAIKELRRLIRAGKEPYKLIIVDQHMPGMDGFELAEYIKNDPRLSSSTMIMMTSDSFNIDLARVNQLGISSYLLKPVKRSDLKETIIKALRMETLRKEKEVHLESFDNLKPVNILLVEDAENNRMLIRSYLKKTPFHIEEAVNGQIAVDKFKTGDYDIILMDMQMPVMDGYAATREIRKFEREKGTDNIPIIALTAHVFKEDIDKSLASGCDSHLTKPIKKNDLIEAIIAHVDRRK